MDKVLSCKLHPCSHTGQGLDTKVLKMHLAFQEAVIVKFSNVDVHAMVTKVILCLLYGSIGNLGEKSARRQNGQSAFFFFIHFWFLGHHTWGCSRLLLALYSGSVWLRVPYGMLGSIRESAMWKASTFVSWAANILRVFLLAFII